MKIKTGSWLEISHLWGLTVVIGVFVFVNTHPIRPHDFWWHLAIGREILSTGQLPTIDVYSYTAPGQPYPSYQMFWLMEVALYSLFRLGGPALVVFANSLVITAAYAILLWICFKVTSNWRVAALATLFAIGVGLNNWNVRPQTVSYLLGSLFLWGIYMYRQRPHPAWLAVFPLGMLAWVNSHGSFPVGLVLIGIWLADETWQWLRAWLKRDSGRAARRLLAPGLALTLTLLACLANPRGPRIVNYLEALTGNQVVQNLVTEWAPATLNTQAGAIFIVGLLLSAIILILSRKRPDFFELAIFLIFALLGLKTIRGAVWFGLVMAPVLAGHLEGIFAELRGTGKNTAPRSGSAIINLVLLVILIAMAIVSLPWLKPFLPLPAAKADLISRETPLEATNFLMANQPPGKLFHDMAFGSYLIWAAQPDYKVFVDPRIELYPAEIWREYLIIINSLPGWEERFEAYGVRSLMLNPQNQAELIKQVDRSADWRRLYADDVAVIYTRQD